jgi:hypothetical protein
VSELSSQLRGAQLRLEGAENLLAAERSRTAALTSTVASLEEEVAGWRTGAATGQAQLDALQAVSHAIHPSAGLLMHADMLPS